MKKFLALAATASVLAFAAPAAAQSWQNINDRQERLDERIDRGVQNGSLTRREASQLRADFQEIVRVERAYRMSNGLSARERDDLDRRFDALSARIRWERNDNQDRGDRGWQNINQRQRALDARIDAGLRDRSLSRVEASRLRAEFQQIARIEQDYRRNGLSQAERRDLDRRFDRLSYRVEAERRDRDNRYG
ncbi:MAG TPA: hypothetical protein VM915_01620 [Verrucomicrobiae bacterium]|nr:hypothetical protein [Verrucomicrobiae bacterium]